MTSTPSFDEILTTKKWRRKEKETGREKHKVIKKERKGGEKGIE
jgi:hypothetical protein